VQDHQYAGIDCEHILTKRFAGLPGNAYAAIDSMINAGINRAPQSVTRASSQRGRRERVQGV
jgi:hypothetical protein